MLPDSDNIEHICAQVVSKWQLVMFKSGAYQHPTTLVNSLLSRLLPAEEIVAQQACCTIYYGPALIFPYIGL